MRRERDYLWFHAATEKSMEKHMNKNRTGKIRELGPWFHNIHLPDGTQTAPDHFLGDFPAIKWREIAPCLPEDLSGYTVLDIGCNAGFYALELAKKGARVTGVDLDSHYLKQADWVIEEWGLKENITLQNKQVYDLAREDTEYDIVWFMGVFYHLRYPMLALDILSQKTKKIMVFQTLTMPGSAMLDTKDDYAINERQTMQHEGWPKMAFIEHKLNADPTNWWAPNQSCIDAMLRTCGFKITARPGHEITVCQPDENNPAVAKDWNRSEYLSAIGLNYQEELKKKTVK